MRALPFLCAVAGGSRISAKPCRLAAAFSLGSVSFLPRLARIDCAPAFLCGAHARRRCLDFVWFGMRKERLAYTFRNDIERTTRCTKAGTMPETKQQKQPLSRELIVDTAFRMIDEKGYRAFTMRALGAELGVSAMAFYAHFSSREEMLAAVCSKFMDTLDTDPIPGERWDDTLRRTMPSLRNGYLRYPNIAEISLDDSVAWLGLAKHTEKIVNLHLSQGMPEDIFRKAWAMVDAFLTGFTGNEAAMIRSATQDDFPDEGSLPEWQRVVRSAYTDESFVNGIEIIIEGVKSIAAPDPCEWYTPLGAADGGAGQGDTGEPPASEAR